MLSLSYLIKSAINLPCVPESDSVTSIDTAGKLLPTEHCDIQ